MDLSLARWRKSSFSGVETDCVEVAFEPGEVGVRDSKNPNGGAIVLPEPAWRALRRLAAVGAAAPRPWPH